LATASRAEEEEGEEDDLASLDAEVAVLAAALVLPEGADDIFKQI
jgi:hypothetical protein